MEKNHVSYEQMYTSSAYLANNNTWHVEDSHWKAKQIISIMNNNNIHPNSVCEIGCGAGEILRQLFLNMNKDISFVGYEISPDAFKLCEQRKEGRLEYKLTNLLEDTSVYYNVVMAIDVIEHVEDCFEFLRKLKQRGEYKIFHIPLEMSVQSVLRMSPLLINRKNVGHIHYFSKDTALSILNDTGYEIIDYFYTPAGIELQKSLKSKIMRLPRRICYSINKDLSVRILGGYSLMVLTK